MAANLPAAFASIANRISAVMGAPFWDGVVLIDGSPGGYDDAGVFQPGAAPTEHACRAQIDGADEYMKASQGYTDKEVQIIVLTAGLGVSLNTDATVRIDDAKAPAMFRGTWLVSSLTLDPAGIGWGGKARRA